MWTCEHCVWRTHNVWYTQTPRCVFFTPTQHQHTTNTHTTYTTSPHVCTRSIQMCHASLKHHWYPVCDKIKYVSCNSDVVNVLCVECVVCVLCVCCEHVSSQQMMLRSVCVYTKCVCVCNIILTHLCINCTVKNCRPVEK